MKNNLLVACILPNLLVSGNLIPREDLFHSTKCHMIKISPDSSHLAYVEENKTGAMNIFVTENLSLQKTTQITYFDEPEIRSFYWAPDGKKILFLKDINGTRQFQLYAVDIASQKVDSLTSSFEKGEVKVFQLNSNENKMAIGIKLRNPLFHDIYTLDLNTYDLTLLYQNDNYVNFLFDDVLNIALKLKINEDASFTLYDKDDNPLFDISSDDAFHTEYLHYNTKENSLYLLDNRDCNTTELRKLALSTNDFLTLGSDSKSDIESVLFEEGVPIAYTTYFTTKKWHPLTEKTRIDLDFLETELGTNFSIIDTSSNKTLWVIKNSLPESGLSYFLYERKNKKLSTLYSSPPLDNPSKMIPLVISSRDGLDLVSYLTLPKRSESEKVPLVVIPHGGPFKVRDYFGYNPYHQWLSNRGYAVLSVNFRLSSGFGKAFVNAGNGEWGKKAHNDILDAIAWCIDNQIANKDKISILGVSYGGYEALAGLTFTPEIFAANIAICGPSNLKTVLDRVPFYWEIPSSPLSEKTYFFTKNAFIKSMGGNLDTFYTSSPLNYVSAIQRPLLLLHGTNDPIVAAIESDQIFDKLKQEGKSVIYLTFPDEGHGINKFANSMTALGFAEWFLALHLGGSYEPLKAEEIGGSSVIIKTSHMHLPTPSN